MSIKDPKFYNLSGDTVRVRDNRAVNDYIYLTIFQEECYEDGVLIPAKNTYLSLNRRDRDILRQILEEPSGE